MTTLSSERPGAPVNIDRSRSASSRLLTQDNHRGTITIKAIKKNNDLTENEKHAIKYKSDKYKHERNISNIDTIYANKENDIDGCTIIEWNGDGRLTANGAEPYVEEYRKLKADIMVILDTGLDKHRTLAFAKQIQYIDPTLTIRSAPAIEGSGKQVGGILIIINEKWAPNTGELHQDNSRTGLIGKFQIRGLSRSYTIICTYWPMPTTGKTRDINESTKVSQKLQQWLKSKGIAGTPLQWIQRIISKWITVAETAVNEDIPIVLGDLNSSTTPSVNGTWGVHGKLHTFLDEIQMVSVQDKLFTTPPRTYWRGDDGISTIDHFLISPRFINHVLNTFTDISADASSLSAHRPIGACINICPKTSVTFYPTIDPPTPVELTIERGEEGYVKTDASIAMNKRLERYVMDNQDWKTARTVGTAERLLLQLNTLAAGEVAKGQRDQQHRFRGKPHGWSPEQVVLYAQLAALVEIRRRMYGLNGRRQWRHHQVRSGIQELTQHWSDMLRKHKCNPNSADIYVGFTPKELIEASPRTLTRSLLDDMIHQVNGHLHYARRAQLRANVKDALREREAAFQSKKIKSVLNRVLQRPTPRFNYRSVRKDNGDIITNPEEIQSELTRSFTKWHERKELIPVAEYICNNDEAWNNFEQQRDIPNEFDNVDPALLRRFTAALLSTEHATELFDEMRAVLTKTITFEEMLRAILARTNSKSPGITGCSINMIKQWTEDVQRFAYELMNYMWEERHVPSWWKNKWVVLVPKDDTPNIPITRLRPISLLETTRKIWTAIIISRIVGVLQKHETLQDMQSGFTAGQSTETCLLQIINAIEQSEQDHSPLFYVSYDISKAFDRPTKGFIKLCWHRIGVPDDIARWLVDLDIGGRSYIKSPWAQRKINKGQIITDTDCEYFIAENGVPQGSSEGAITWLVIFDVLLTMLRNGNTNDIFVRDAEGKLHTQWPTAFADDLMTYAATFKACQKQAWLTSGFCMLTGLEIAPSKMTARAFYVTETVDPMEIRMYTISGSSITIPIDHGNVEQTLLRYLGLYIEPDHSWTGQLQKIVDKVAETVRVLTHSRASSTIKWYAISKSSYTGIMYPSKFAPWSMDEYTKLLSPLHRVTRTLTGNRRTIASQLLTGPPKYGYTGLNDLVAMIQKEKYKMVQRAQENGGLSNLAVNRMLTRLTEINNIPATIGSPILLAHMDMTELKKAKNWISSAVEYANLEGYGWGRTGLNQSGTSDEKVPRPIHGTPSYGAIGWLAERDVITMGDMTITSRDDQGNYVTKWITEAQDDYEPRWREAITWHPPPTTPLTLRRGHMLISDDRSQVFEFIAPLKDFGITIRRWKHPGGKTPIEEGDSLCTTDSYYGDAGTNLLQENDADWVQARRILYKTKQNGQIILTHISEQTIENGKLRVQTLLTIAPPWVAFLIDKLRSRFGSADVDCYTDGSFTAGNNILEQFAEPVSPNTHLASAGMVFTTTSDNWEYEPILGVHIHKGNTIDADSVFPMELMALTAALVIAKHYPRIQRIVTDSQSSMDTVRPALMSTKHRFRNYKQAHITLACRDHLPSHNEVEIVKVKSHVELRSSQESTWSRDEIGNVMADMVASTEPQKLVKQYPQAVILPFISAEELTSQLTHPDIWNIYGPNMAPTTWERMDVERDRRLHEQYLQKRTESSARIGRHRNWTDRHMTFTAKLWKVKKVTPLARTRIMKIIYDQYWHGGNRSKSLGQRDLIINEEAACDLCGCQDSQKHMILECGHAAMTTLREAAIDIIKANITAGISTSCVLGTDKIAAAFHDLWNTQLTEDIWIGRWNRNMTKLFTENLEQRGYRGLTTTVVTTLISLYTPIIAYVYLCHTLRAQIIQSGGHTTRIAGPEIIIGKWYNHLILPKGDIYNSDDATQDSDWNDIDAMEDRQLIPHTRRKRQRQPLKRRRQSTTETPPCPEGITRYPRIQTPHLPVQPVQRHRVARMTTTDIKNLISTQNVEALNSIATARKLEGIDQAYIDIDEDGHGLCLRSRSHIEVTTRERKLWEYVGTVKEVPATENSNAIPIEQLKFGCEYSSGGKTYRRYPKGPLEGMAQYMQASSPGQTPNCRLVTDHRTNRTYVYLIRSIQEGEQFKIDYGIYYWQLFWTHLNTRDQSILIHEHPDITFPPIWPQYLSNTSSVRDRRQHEWNYALASRNIYDELQDDEGCTIGVEDNDTSMANLISKRTDQNTTHSHMDNDDTRIEPIDGDLMTQAQTAFKVKEWTVEKHYHKNGEDNLIVAIDDSLRRLQTGKHKTHLKKRSITQYRTLLIKALEAYEQHDTPIPQEHSQRTDLELVSTLWSDDNTSNPQDFLDSLQRTVSDGEAITLTAPMGRILRDAIIVETNRHTRLWYKYNHTEIINEVDLQVHQVPSSTKQILVVCEDRTIQLWVRSDDASPQTTSQSNKPTRKHSEVPPEGRITYFFESKKRRLENTAPPITSDHTKKQRHKCPPQNRGTNDTESYNAEGSGYKGSDSKSRNSSSSGSSSSSSSTNRSRSNSSNRVRASIISHTDNIQRPQKGKGHREDDKFIP